MIEQEELKSFFRFIERRQRAWWRKEHLEAEPPWSKDEILQQAHFTNVYRELDPGTAFVFDVMAADERGLGPADLAFWILFYRYTGSNRHVFKYIDWTPVRKFSEPRIISQMRKHNNPFGNAYLVYPMTNEKTSKDKVQTVVEAFGDIADIWPKHYPRIVQAAEQDFNPDAAYKMIRESRKGIGPFSAFQTWVDYCMMDLIPDMRDIWVMPGPGAIRGASIIWGEELGWKAAAGACLVLHDKFKERWKKKLCAKPEWAIMGKPPYLSDIQNCLCEYQKYVRVRDTGKITRRYGR